MHVHFIFGSVEEIEFQIEFHPSYIIEPHYEKTNDVVSEQVQHKPSYTSTEDR